jgi:phosphohistidine phosphatase
MSDSAAREVLIMRHGKSDWDTGDPDHERPLSERGRRDAARMADWMADHDLEPDRIVTSSAKRAAATAQFVVDRFSIGPDRVDVRDELYLANAWTWLAALEDCPQGVILLCGHNPGLDDLVEYLCGDPLRFTADGKLMTTAAVAHLAFNEEWSGIGRGSGHLLHLVRPREL